MVSDWFEIVVGSTRTILQQVSIFAPKLLASLLLFVFAYVVAKIVQKVSTRLIQALGADRLASKSGIADFLQGSGFRKPVSWYAGRLLFWIVILLCLLPIADILELKIFADVVSRVVYYLPNLLVALIILVLGFWAARVLGGLTEGAVSRVGGAAAKGVGTAVRIFVLFVAVIIALAQLEIATGILEWIVGVAVLCLGATFALSIGLGSVDIVRNLLAGYYLQKQVAPGTVVRIGQDYGTIRHIGPLVSLVRLSESGKEIAIPNTQFVQQPRGNS